MQKCLSRNSSIPWNYSKTFLPAKLSKPQFIISLELFKGFSACKFVLAAIHQFPGFIQRLFRLQNCLSRKSSKSWKYSKTFRQATSSSNHPAATSNRSASSIPAATSNHLATSSHQQQSAATSSIPAATSNHPATSSN